jgi:hypothetical protein
MSQTLYAAAIFSDIMTNISGMGVNSTGDENVFAISFTAYTDGTKHKLGLLSIGRDPQDLELIFSKTGDFLRKNLDPVFLHNKNPLPQRLKTCPSLQ